MSRHVIFFTVAYYLLVLSLIEIRVSKGFVPSTSSSTIRTPSSQSLNTPVTEKSFDKVLPDTYRNLGIVTTLRYNEECKKHVRHFRGMSPYSTSSTVSSLFMFRRILSFSSNYDPKEQKQQLMTIEDSLSRTHSLHSDSNITGSSSNETATDDNVTTVTTTTFASESNIEEKISLQKSNSDNDHHINKNSKLPLSSLTEDSHGGNKTNGKEDGPDLSSHSSRNDQDSNNTKSIKPTSGVTGRNKNFTKAVKDQINVNVGGGGLSYLGGFGGGNYKFPEFTFFPSLTPPLPSPAATTSSGTASTMNTTWVELLKEKQPNETVTVADLEMILSQMAESSKSSLSAANTGSGGGGGVEPGGTNYVIKPQYQSSPSTNSPIPYPYSIGRLPSQQQYPSPSNPQQQSIISSSSLPSSSSKQVAFPQPSILSGQSIQRGTSVASSLLGLILSTTIFPNLWLIGSVLGTLYGIEITKDLVEDDDKTEEDEDEDEDDSTNEDTEDEDMSTRGNVIPKRERIRQKSILARSLIAAGSQLASWALQLYDYWKAMFFLYKTGQLSYEYWKTYSSLDRRFAIQDKIDAWNGRFAEGKRKFDAWEQENEVGRTILAGLRTVWLVDEQARKRVSAKQTSRFRLLQYVYNVKYWIKRRLVKARAWISNQVAPDGSFQDILEGIRSDLTSQDAARPRIRSVITAIIFINVGGSLFSLSPFFCSLMGCIAAIIWPSWATELFTRVGEVGEELQDRGKSNSLRSSGSSSSSSGGSNVGFSAPRLLGMYDKKRYHYYVRPDGKKRWYRTGKSQFSNSATVSTKRKTSSKKTKKKNRGQNSGGIMDAFSWFTSDDQRGYGKDSIGTWGFFRKTK